HMCMPHMPLTHVSTRHSPMVSMLTHAHASRVRYIVGIKDRQEDRPPLSLPTDRKLHAARACHFKPAAVRCTDRRHENAIAMAASQNCSHLGGIERQRAHGSGRVACRALKLGCRYLKSEDFLKETRGRIAVEHGGRVVLSHHAYPPEGPKRSVLIVTGSYPRSTRSLDTFSTKGVGPQTKIFGFC